MTQQWPLNIFNDCVIKFRGYTVEAIGVGLESRRDLHLKFAEFKPNRLVGRVCEPRPYETQHGAPSRWTRQWFDR